MFNMQALFNQLHNPCPLPEKIPRPTPSQLVALTDMGIFVKSTTEPYTGYILPENWAMVDQSCRADIPIYVIVDAKNQERVAIAGSWKGSYDNELQMKIQKEPYTVYHFRTIPTPKEPSQSEQIAVNTLMGVAGEIPSLFMKEPFN